LLEKYKNEIKVIFKNFPLPMHPFARNAAAAALAAHRQGKFREFHHKLFESSAGLNDDKIRGIARELKLNMKKFNRDLNDSAVQAIIDRDVNEGREAEVPGTPTLFINGKLAQLRSPQDIVSAIDSELRKKTR
jgi:protein-disulfide isomerase